MSKETNVVTKDVNATTLVEPKFVTLVGKPANQIGFKVVRSEESNVTEETNSVRIKRVRAKRSMGPMLSVVFPAGTSEDEVNRLMSEYGLTDYKVETSDEAVVAIRSDLEKLPEDVTTIGIGNGMKAVIARGAVVTPPQDVTPFVAVTAFRFDKEQFADDEAVMLWLEKHDVDFLENGVKNGDTFTTVQRADVKEDAEKKEIVIGDGVTVEIVRADVQDIPVPFVEVVSETAYGSWGWGQLDFAAAMADMEYSRMADDGLYRLRNLLENLLLYSPLSVSVRKELVNRALSQFGEFVGNLLDALPSKVVMINRSILESKEKEMSNKQDAQNVEKDVQRSDDGKNVTAQTETKAEYVTRAELSEAITAGVAAALKAAGVQRTDEKQDESTTEEVKDESKADATSSEEVMRSLSKLTETVGKMAETVNSRLEQIEGQTVVRSDDADPVQQKVQRQDVFKGVLGGTLTSGRGE